MPTRTAQKKTVHSPKLRKSSFGYLSWLALYPLTNASHEAFMHRGSDMGSFQNAWLSCSMGPECPPMLDEVLLDGNKGKRAGLFVNVDEVTSASVSALK